MYVLCACVCMRVFVCAVVFTLQKRRGALVVTDCVAANTHARARTHTHTHRHTDIEKPTHLLVPHHNDVRGAHEDIARCAARLCGGWVDGCKGGMGE